MLSLSNFSRHVPFWISLHGLCFFVPIVFQAILQFYLDFGDVALHDADPSLRTFLRTCLSRYLCRFIVYSQICLDIWITWFWFFPFNKRVIVSTIILFGVSGVNCVSESLVPYLLSQVVFKAKFKSSSVIHAMFRMGNSFCDCIFLFFSSRENFSSGNCVFFLFIWVALSRMIFTHLFLLNCVAVSLLILLLQKQHLNFWIRTGESFLVLFLPYCLRYELSCIAVALSIDSKLIWYFLV